MVGIVLGTCCHISCVSFPVISHIIRVCVLKSTCFSNCGIRGMRHVTFSYHSNFLSNSSTPGKGEMFVRNATKSYELAPTINKAESLCQMIKDMPCSVVLGICQSLCPS